MSVNDFSWQRKSIWRTTALLTIGLVQMSGFVLAWPDLHRRSPDQLNGSKTAWRVALFSTGIGLFAYVLTVRRHSRWTEADVPNLRGKIAIVTGANSGLGLETTRALVAHGATVIMACRNPQKAEEAAISFRQAGVPGEVIVLPLDLADLTSVQHFAETFQRRFDRLDLLVNNAGLRSPPYATTAQDFESQFGVNHLGHFALTAQLINRLNATPGARVVSVSSIAHRSGQIDFTDLNWTRRPYRAIAAYAQSKLATLLFTAELQRRLLVAGHTTLAVTAHPGWASTGLPGEGRRMPLVNRLFAQSAQMGALPTLYAATATHVRAGGFYGPSGVLELGGAPEQVAASPAAQQPEVARRLWHVSEQLTGVHIDL